MHINVKFDHQAKHMHGVLGITEYEMNYARMAIVFETISSSLLIQKLYESEDDAPRELKTESGLIERILGHATSDGMRVYMLLNFQRGFESTAAIAEEAKKLEEELQKPVMDGIQGALKSLVKTLKLESIRNTIRAVEESNFSFQAFVKKVLPDEAAMEGAKDKMRDIDQMLGGILGREDDDEDPE